ncbi:hypothetical protein EAS56_08070 [Bradyrhizobium guangzhouense]|nr:hypothetical protein EAS56_08070 [Bradyrhizobium guangzhouense]
MITSGHVEVLAVDQSTPDFNSAIESTFTFSYTCIAKRYATIGISVSHSRNDVGDRRFGPTQVKTLDFFDSRASWRRDKDDQGVMCREGQLFQDRVVVALDELDRAIERGNVLPG